VRIGFDNPGTAKVVMKSFHTACDTRHNINNSTSFAGAATTSCGRETMPSCAARSAGSGARCGSYSASSTHARASASTRRGRGTRGEAGSGTSTGRRR
jgi:hypothetical protein